MMSGERRSHGVAHVTNVAGSETVIGRCSSRCSTIRSR
jgi:hypothetical protein